MFKSRLDGKYYVIIQRANWLGREDLLRGLLSWMLLRWGGSDG